MLSVRGITLAYFASAGIAGKRNENNSRVSAGNSIALQSWIDFFVKLDVKNSHISRKISGLAHAGDIVLTNESKTGTELLIRNNHIGNNDTMAFNSKITGDRLFPDKLIIRGRRIGNTNISINNIGRMCDICLNRFELIHIDGFLTLFLINQDVL